MADVDVGEIGIDLLREENFGSESGFMKVGGDEGRLDAAGLDFGD